MASISKKRKSPGYIDEIETENHLQSPQQPDPPGILEAFQKSIDDIRALIYCGICVRPLYEPFTLECGHTFCYGCLTQWFISHRRKKTCPDCRAPVRYEPAPAYMIRNIVQIFINRAELLDKEETTAEHLTYQRAETERIESDRKNKDLVSGGLFQGCFRHARAPGVPIRDLADGVERCPWCTWELEGGECTRCGFARDELDHFDRQAALMELLHGDGPEPGFDSEDFGMGDYEYDYDTDDIPGMPARVRLSSQTQTDSENEDSEDDSDEDDMGSFIDDDENGDSSSTEGHGTVSSTLAGNQNSELFAVSSDGPSQIADSMSEGTSLHSFGDMSRNPTIIELDDDDGEDEDDVGEGDDDHDDDEPIMTAAMATRRRRQISSSSSFASDTSVPRSQPNDGSASDNSDSDEPRGPVRRTRRGVTATS